MEIQDLVQQARELLVVGSEKNARSATTRILDALAADRVSGGIADEADLSASIETQLTGFGVLQPYLDDEEIEEIWLNRPNEIFYSKAGLSIREELALDRDQLQTFIQRMLRESNRRVDRVSPFADSALSDGSRLHVVIPEITAAHWAINLRKFHSKFRNLAQLQKIGMLDEAQAAFLSKQVQAGKNILISGPTQAGKTTLLNALLNELEKSTRLISCEEIFEISCDLEDWVAMQTRQANIEGSGEIPLRKLVKEALRMRPERLVIGEVREAESFDLLIAMNSGIPGLCTLHANSAQAALQKLSTLPLLAGTNITSDFVTSTIATSLDFVVQLSKDLGIRKVSEICGIKLIDGKLQAKAVKL